VAAGVILRLIQAVNANVGESLKPASSVFARVMKSEYTENQRICSNAALLCD
jgi:hypothetical protein